MKTEETNIEHLSKERLSIRLKRKERELQAKTAEIERLQRRLQALQIENAVLKERLQAAEHPVDGYRSEWSWVRKIVFVLEKADRPLRSPEIIGELAKREEHLRQHWN